MKRRFPSYQVIFLWLCVLFWYGGISFLSNQPRLPGPQDLTQQFLWFKSGHLMAYGVLSLLVYMAWQATLFQYTKWSQAIQLQRSVFFTVFTILILASLDEIHQYFVPGRGPHVRDVFIDLTSTCAVLLFFLRKRQLGRRRAEAL